MKLQTHEEQINDLLEDLSLSPEEKKRNQTKKRVANFRSRHPEKKDIRIIIDNEIKEILDQNKPENITIKDYIKNALKDYVKNSKK